MNTSEASVRLPGLLRTLDAVLRGAYADKTWLDRGRAAASTSSYPFLLLLHVLFCAVGGLLSLVVLQRAARASFGAEDPRRPTSRRLLGVRCVVYAADGAQMGWLLRPFLGTPGQPFTWFHARESNFFAALLQTLADLLKTKQG